MKSPFFPVKSPMFRSNLSIRPRREIGGLRRCHAWLISSSFRKPVRLIIISMCILYIYTVYIYIVYIYIHVNILCNYIYIYTYCVYIYLHVYVSLCVLTYRLVCPSFHSTVSRVPNILDTFGW